MATTANMEKENRQTHARNSNNNRTKVEVQQKKTGNSSTELEQAEGKKHRIN